ncbi:hypothetical protein EV132_102244 [Rhizobium sullae]|uniref:Uncharacterized protein n=1 Tax=Rhizobium sullae TaxID=50338 RepID=A0A4V2V9Z3_RHISU|nr:hypothetical protein EV132_102244 [Rhizobium sullae]
MSLGAPAADLGKTDLGNAVGAKIALVEPGFDHRLVPGPLSYEHGVPGDIALKSLAARVRCSRGENQMLPISVDEFSA